MQLFQAPQAGDDPIRSDAAELARFGIRVNALAPGYIETDLNDGFWESDAGRAMLRRIPQRRLAGLEDLDRPLCCSLRTYPHI